MYNKQILFLSLGGISVLLGGITACNPTPFASPTSPSSQMPIVAVQASTNPSANVPEPSLQPVPLPAPSISPIPSAIPTPTPTPIMTPSPIQYCEHCGPGRTRFSGVVFDDQHRPMEGVLIRAEVLNNRWWFQEQTLTDSQGNYHFENAPAGMQMVIVASKVGFTTRKRVEVLSENRAGNPNVNRYDFGTNGGLETFSRAYDALSDKPEVIWVEPRRNDSQVNPQTGFVLKFSEPMDTQSVEDCFALFSFLKRKLTVDSENSQRAYTLLGNGLIANNFQPPNSTRIWDKSAFQILWNSDQTEMTLRFLPSKSLPTDRSIDRAPDYNLAFFANGSGNRVIKDAKGTARSEKHFKLTDGDFEESYKFALKNDEALPTVLKISQDPLAPRGSSLILTYSKPMSIETQSLQIAGGMADERDSFLKAPAGYPGAKNSSPSQAAENYQLVIRNGRGERRFAGTWAQFGGEVHTHLNDISRHTVRLSLPPYAGDAEKPERKALLAQYQSGGKPLTTGEIPSLFEPGDSIEVQVSETVMDPAGNTVDIGRNYAKLILF